MEKQYTEEEKDSIWEVLCNLLDILMEIEMEQNLWMDFTPYMTSESLKRLWLTRTPLEIAKAHNEKVLAERKAKWED